MREGKFIDKNINRWQEYMDETNDPDIQAERFVNLVDDLSFAKTYYPQSKTTQFINGLAAKQFFSASAIARRCSGLKAARSFIRLNSSMFLSLAR